MVCIAWVGAALIGGVFIGLVLGALINACKDD